MKTDEEISKEVLKKIDRKHKGSIFDKEQQVGMISEHIKEAIALTRQDCKKKKQPNCNKCNRELRVYFSEDFAGSNEGTSGWYCDYCDGQKVERERILEIIDKWIEKGFGLYNGNDFESLEELEKEVLKE